jgi:hypothetical protein
MGHSVFSLREELNIEVLFRWRSGVQNHEFQHAEGEWYNTRFYLEFYILGYNALLSVESQRMFGRDISPPSSGRCRRNILPKPRLTFNKLQGVICQKIELFITTAVRTLNPTSLFTVHCSGLLDRHNNDCDLFQSCLRKLATINLVYYFS